MSNCIIWKNNFGGFGRMLLNFDEFISCELHEKHTIEPINLGTISAFIGFEVFTAVTMKQSAATCSRWFFARGFFYPEDEKRYDPPKRRFNRPHLHGATPQKTAFFISAFV
jgi:hypothetical protein